jgi:ABC-type Fe3+ transport system substrate-binding protein
LNWKGYVDVNVDADADIAGEVDGEVENRCLRLRGGAGSAAAAAAAALLALGLALALAWLWLLAGLMGRADRANAVGMEEQLLEGEIVVAIVVVAVIKSGQVDDREDEKNIRWGCATVLDYRGEARPRPRIRG